MNQILDTMPELFSSGSKRIINTPSAAAKKCFFYVQETGYLKVVKSHLTKRRQLESFLIVCVLSGEGTMNFDGKTHAVKGGDGFFLNCIKPHFYQSSDSNPWELMWVHFCGATSGGYYETIIKEKGNVFDSSENIVSVLEDIIDTNENKNHESEVKSSLLLLKLLTEILIGAKKPQSEAAMQDNTRMNEIKTRIDREFTEKLTLEQLSEEYFISMYHLSREFKRIYGTTFSNYLITKRINYAKRLLRFSGLSIEEIAQRSGFHDTSHFSRLFKQNEGITPIVYRKNWRN